MLLPPNGVIVEIWPLLRLPAKAPIAGHRKRTPGGCPKVGFSLLSVLAFYNLFTNADSEPIPPDNHSGTDRSFSLGYTVDSDRE